MNVALRRNTARAAAHVALPPEEICHLLKGHSGARVVLHSNGAHSFVRKTAHDRSSNERLSAQMEKQRQLGASGVPFPRVLASGTDETGCAYFDMAYVPGLTVAQAVLEATVFDADALVSAVERMFWLFRACRGNHIEDDRFRRKISDVARSHRAAPNCSSLVEQVGRCADILLRLDWNGIPSSPSHGDLTLENVMLGAERSVVFIDCDEAWVSSYWLDLGKLFQDLYGHWCLRNSSEQTGAQRANATGKLAHLAGIFESVARKDNPALAARLRQLAALNLFRALPYATDAQVESFICTRILRLLEV